MVTIRPTVCNVVSLPDTAEDLGSKTNVLTWSTVISPLAPAIVFGRLVDKLLIGNSGQLKFLPGNATKWAWPWEKCKIPESLNDLIEGRQIIPFGEPLLTKG